MLIYVPFLQRLDLLLIATFQLPPKPRNMTDSLDHNIDLLPAEDETSVYRFTTEVQSYRQRRQIIERGSPHSLLVQTSVVQVVHGTLSNGEPASLIVTDFRFISRARSRRFKSATINYTFKAVEPDATGPTVIDIAPRGYVSLTPTGTMIVLPRGSSTSSSSEGSDNSARSSISGSLWERSESKMTLDQTLVAGTMRSELSKSGETDTARWMLSENESQKTGIPTLLRTAILLERKKKEENQKFLATVDIKASVDLAYSMRNAVDMLIGRIAKDDPITFDPQKCRVTGPVDLFEPTKLGGINEYSKTLNFVPPKPEEMKGFARASSFDLNKLDMFDIDGLSSIITTSAVS